MGTLGREFGPDTMHESFARCAGPGVECSSTADAMRRLGIGPTSRIIEFDVDTPAVARSLIAAGYSNYLGIARDCTRLSELQVAAPDIAHLFQLIHTPTHLDQLRQSNADVAILSGDTPSYLHHALYVRQFRAVIWRPRGLGQISISRFWASYKRIRGHLGPLHTIRFLDSAARSMEYWTVPRFHIKPAQKRFVGGAGGLPHFFQQLEEASVNYVVLRWFEHLPIVDPHEDIDLLVADQDWPQFSGIVESSPGIIPCDIYTPSGLPGTRYQGLAYYPRQVANEILETRVRNARGFYTPSLQHYFLSLAYHAVYHKGEASGLPFGNQAGTNDRRPYHRYGDMLSQLAAQLGYQVEANLVSLHEMLQERGWTPEVDTLRKLSSTNHWLSSVLPDGTQDLQCGELLVFVVRDWATSRNLTGGIAQWFQGHGLQIIAVKELSTTEQALALKLRGGVWGDGAADQGRPSGGYPRALIVAFDSHPEPPRAEDRAKFPYVNNAHLFLKHRVREEFQPGTPDEYRVNFIHSADDELEAWDYLRLACPDLVNQVRERVAELRQSLYQPS